MNYPVIPRTFFSGDCFDAYRILGAHPCTDPNGAEGWRFAVWAPGATAVEVCGGFDGWERGVPMEKADTGVWSAFIPGLAEGDLYKYRVHGADGSTVMRSDPYAFATELRPGTASKLTKLDFTFDDTAWMERRDKCRNRPLNIYGWSVGGTTYFSNLVWGTCICIFPVFCRFQESSVIMVPNEFQRLLIFGIIVARMVEKSMVSLAGLVLLAVRAGNVAFSQAAFLHSSCIWPGSNLESRPDTPVCSPCRSSQIHGRSYSRRHSSRFPLHYS